MLKPRSLASLVTGACALALLLPAAAPAAQDTFLKIDGIPGESLDAKHKDEIDVLSWNWGVSANNKSKPKFQDFSLTKRVDSASPQLLVNIASGRASRTALLTVRKPGDKPIEYLTYCMTDVQVTGLSTAGDGDGATEQVSLSFGSFFETYQRQNQAGALTPFTGGYDLVRNVLLTTSAC